MWINAQDIILCFGGNVSTDHDFWIEKKRENESRKISVNKIQNCTKGMKRPEQDIDMTFDILFDILNIQHFIMFIVKIKAQSFFAKLNVFFIMHETICNHFCKLLLNNFFFYL